MSGLQFAASRDGNVAAYAVSPPQVLVHDIAAQTTWTLPGRPSSNDSAAHVYIYDATTGTTTEPFPDDIGEWPLISGDGTTVAMFYWAPNAPPTDNGGIIVKRIGTGRPTAADYVMHPPSPDGAAPIRLSRDGGALAYRCGSAAWNRQGAGALQTWSAGGGHHHAGGAYDTYPLSADFGDDDGGLLNTLLDLDPPADGYVPGVWWELLS